MEQLPPTLIDVLANSLVLREIAPYLYVSDLFNLLKVNISLRHILLSQPEPWRYLDLSTVRAAKIDASPIDTGGISWRAERMDEALTEDDFYAGPLRGIFNKLRSGSHYGEKLSRLDQPNLLRHVHTLVLDGLTVPADLVREIVCEDHFNVRILSIRECKHLNQSKLQQVLRYACRPTRPANTPRLRGLYYFGLKDSIVIKSTNSSQAALSKGITTTAGAQIGAHHSSFTDLEDPHKFNETEKWYNASGRAIKRPQSEWPETLQVCKGIIAFDAALCRGPRHDITKVSSTHYLPAIIAMIALGSNGCETCSSSPEGAIYFNQDDSSALPLLSPPPLHTSEVRYARTPANSNAPTRFFLRCEDCQRSRWCERCQRWWCETCYESPVTRRAEQSEPTLLDEAARAPSDGNIKIGVHRDCFDCGRTCHDCSKKYMRMCGWCSSEYCVIDDEGSTEKMLVLSFGS